MALQECKMVMVWTNKPGYDDYPWAEAIVIVPLKQSVEKYAIPSLYPYRPKGSSIYTKELGKILFTPVPTTVFLYTQSAGRIK